MTILGEKKNKSKLFYIIEAAAFSGCFLVIGIILFIVLNNLKKKFESIYTLINILLIVIILATVILIIVRSVISWNNDKKQPKEVILFNDETNEFIINYPNKKIRIRKENLISLKVLLRRVANNDYSDNLNDKLSSKIKITYQENHITKKIITPTVYDAPVVCGKIKLVKGGK